MDWSGLGFVPANLAWQNGHWNPLESTGVHMEYVGEGKDLSHMHSSILLDQDQPYDSSMDEVQVEAASLEMVSHAPVQEQCVAPCNLEAANR